MKKKYLLPLLLLPLLLIPVYAQEEAEIPSWIKVVAEVLVPTVIAENIEPDEILWIGGEKGIRQVPLYYIEKITVCGEVYEKIIRFVRGCYYTLYVEMIVVEKQYRNVGTTVCDNTRTHEIIHAWVGHSHNHQIFEKCNRIMGI